ncbi:MAG: helix-turn-helix transcriptional regulator [Verrucomicrobium sp.]
MLRNVHEAIRMIHAHGSGALHERVFAALDLLFAPSHYGFEIFSRDGRSYALETNLPFAHTRISGIMDRTGELVKAQSPMFAQLAAGETEPMRMSDFLSVREIRDTALYQEVFRHIGVLYQIGIPIQSEVCMGGLTINREQVDYTPEDAAVAALLAPQIATAFEVDLYIRSLKGAQAATLRLPLAASEAAEVDDLLDHPRLRRQGLSRRECEVLHWLSEGKRDGEIAVVLNISVRTVNQHVLAILAKLRVETRTAAVAVAIRLRQG